MGIPLIYANSSISLRLHDRIKELSVFSFIGFHISKIYLYNTNK